MRTVYCGCMNPYHQQRAAHTLTTQHHTYLVDEVPVLVGHLVEGDVTEDTRVVDHDVYAPPRVHRRLHDARTLHHRVVVRHRLPARRLDLVDHEVGGAAAGALARGGTAEVVHDDLACGQVEGRRGGVCVCVCVWSVDIVVYGVWIRAVCMWIVDQVLSEEERWWRDRQLQYERGGTWRCRPGTQRQQ